MTTFDYAVSSGPTYILGYFTACDEIEDDIDAVRSSVLELAQNHANVFNVFWDPFNLALKLSVYHEQ